MYFCAAMRYYFDYIFHFLVSNSRHGTHSPFVYALTEKVIYNPSYKGQNFVEFPEGFNPNYFPLLKKIWSFWEVNTLSKDLQDKDAQSYWIDGKEDSEVILSLIDAGKIIVFHEPYKQKRQWKKLIDDQRVTVSINLFHFGILLKREGQRKQDFLLRYL